MENKYSEYKYKIMSINDKIDEIQKLFIKNSNLSITINDIHILEKLKKNDGISIKALANLCNVTNATMTVQVKKLEANKYLNKTRDKIDRRGMVLNITEKGGEIVNYHEEHYTRMIDEVFSALKPDEIELVYKVLVKIEKTLYEEIEDVKSKSILEN